MRIDDVHDVVDQYPEFSAAALDRGIISSLSLPLTVAEASVGVVNLYARSAHGFEGRNQQLASEITDIAADALRLRRGDSESNARANATDITNIIRSRAVIEQATGILMAQSLDRSADNARELLVGTSQRDGVELRVIAQQVVEGGTNAPLSLRISPKASADYSRDKIELQSDLRGQPPDGFRAVIERDGRNLTVIVRGELDVATRPILWNVLSEAIAETDAASISVDLRDLEFIDAHGIGVLVSARDVLLAQSRDMRILNLSTTFARLVAIAGRGALLECCEQTEARVLSDLT